MKRLRSNNKFYLLLILVILFSYTGILYAEGNIVRIKTTKEIVYRQDPNFEDGNGIKNALFLNPKLKAEDLEEVNLSKSDFKKTIDDEMDKEKLKKAEQKVKEDKIQTRLGLTNADWQDLKEALK